MSDAPALGFTVTLKDEDGNNISEPATTNVSHTGVLSFEVPAIVALQLMDGTVEIEIGEAHEEGDE